jgi:hypothetical protein
MKAKYVNPFTDEKAEIAKHTRSELHDYEQSLKIYRDLKGVIDTAFFDGKVTVATKMKAKGMDVDIITELTGLSKEEIAKL